MKILVTGGAGFIGSHVVDKYLAIGHKVVVMDDLSTGKEAFVNPQATFYKVDIRDKVKVAEIFAKEKPEVLNHHAAQMDVRRSVADPIFDAGVNILGFLNLLEAGRQNELKQVIFASSGGTVYGDAAILPTPETAPTLPTSPYGISKLTSEYYLNFYQQTYGIPFVVLRYGNVYGPRQNPYGEAGVVAIFAQKILAGVQPVINGDGEQSRDFVFVEDVVEANVMALNNVSPTTLNIGTGQATTVNQIFSKIARLTNTEFQPQHGPAMPGEQRISVLDTTLVLQLLNWKPRVPLDEGLRRTVAYFQNEKA